MCYSLCLFKNDKFVILSANLLPAIQEKNVYSKPILYRTIENNGNWRRLLVIGLYWNVVRNQNFEEFFFIEGGGGAEYWEFPIEKKVVKDMKWMIENQAFALSFVCLYMYPFSAACTLLGPSPLRTSISPVTSLKVHKCHLMALLLVYHRLFRGAKRW